MSRLKSGESAANVADASRDAKMTELKRTIDRCRTGIEIPDQLEERDFGRKRVISDVRRSEDQPVYDDSETISATHPVRQSEERNGE